MEVIEENVTSDLKQPIKSFQALGDSDSGRLPTNIVYRAPDFLTEGTLASHLVTKARLIVWQASITSQSVKQFKTPQPYSTPILYITLYPNQFGQLSHLKLNKKSIQSHHHHVHTSHKHSRCILPSPPAQLKTGPSGKPSSNPASPAPTSPLTRSSALPLDQDIPRMTSPSSPPSAAQRPSLPRPHPPCPAHQVRPLSR